MCLSWIRDLICGKEIENTIKLNPPNGLDSIDVNEISTLLASEFPDAKLLFADRDYKTVSKSELERFLKDNKTDLYKYVSEYMDCDDYSFCLMGAISNPDWGALPFGIVWTEVPNGAHAVNCFIDKKRKVWICEPQTDALFSCPSDWHPYLVII